MSEVTAWWGAVTGTIALFISGYNAWHATTMARVQLTVEPEMTRDPTGVGSSFAVRLVNNSSFDVTIQKAGVVTRNTDGQLDAVVLDGFPSAMPMTLLPRKRASIQMTMRSTIGLAIDTFDHEFVETATGKIVRSSKRHPFVGKTLGQLQAEAKIKAPMS